MKKEATKITLIAATQKGVFEFSHAERILKMDNNGGWQLPENSLYKFDKENGIRISRDKREAKNKEI